MSLTPYDGQLVTSGIDLAAWANDASQVHKMAQALATTSFVPKTMQGRPDEITAQIMYGRDVNLPPMVALQQIHVIEGRPALSALSMRGMAQSHGVKFRLDESSETRCKYSALAPGDADWTTVTWTFDRAKKLGVTTKSNWTKQPQAMLVARATAELCRLVAAPLFLGLSYSVEELRDGADDVDPAPKPTRVRATRPATEPEPDVEPEPTRTIRRDPVKAAATVEPQQTGAPAQFELADKPEHVAISDKYRRALMAGFRDVGLSEREERLHYVSTVLGRKVGSVNEVDDAEAKTILDSLDRDYRNNNPTGDDAEPAQ